MKSQTNIKQYSHIFNREKVKSHFADFSLKDGGRLSLNSAQDFPQKTSIFGPKALHLTKQNPKKNHSPHRKHITCGKTSFKHGVTEGRVPIIKMEI